MHQQLLLGPPPIPTIPTQVAPHQTGNRSFQDQGTTIRMNASNIGAMPTFLISPQKCGRLAHLEEGPDGMSIRLLASVRLNDRLEDFLYEPAYCGQRLLINTGSGRVFTSYGGEIVADGEPYVSLMNQLREGAGGKNVWFEALWPTIGPAGATRRINALIVLDWVITEVTYKDRRLWLASRFKELGIKELPSVGHVYLSPGFRSALAGQLFMATASRNIELHDKFFRGVISKRLMTYYVHQKRSINETSAHRRYYPFAGLDGYHDV